MNLCRPCSGAPEGELKKLRHDQVWTRRLRLFDDMPANMEYNTAVDPRNKSVYLFPAFPVDTIARPDLQPNQPPLQPSQAQVDEACEELQRYGFEADSVTPRVSGKL